ncbi:MAG: LysR family transcriptional regulator [Pseudolabrys sp.]|nr:LysR family transcriptional regulator [Pseudolabrys sp.]
MNLRQLKYFIGVVDAGNMTRGAEQLHVAQTALGMQIRQIEEEIGVALLVRHSRGVEPTPAGKLLYSRAHDILRLVEETRREVAACEGDSVEAVRLGITPALMLACGSDIAIAVRERLRGVSLSMVEAMSHVLVEMLSRGEVDLILCYDVPDLPQFSRTALLQDELVLVTQPDGRNGKPVAFADALDRNFAMPEEGDTVRSAVSRVARDLGLELKIIYEVRSVSAMKSLVNRGLASSILPYFSVADDVRNGTLDAQPITMPPIRRTLFLAASKQRPQVRNEIGITGAIRTALTGLMETLGPLAYPLWSKFD